MTPEQFWGWTPHETVEYVTAQLDHQRERDVTMAWLSATLQRGKKMPRLDSLLAKTKARRQRPQTPEELRSRALAAFGLKADG